jgi:hypothetical protein
MMAGFGANGSEASNTMSARTNVSSDLAYLLGNTKVMTCLKQLSSHGWRSGIGQNLSVSVTIHNRTIGTRQKKSRRLDHPRKPTASQVPIGLPTSPCHPHLQDAAQALRLKICLMTSVNNRDAALQACPCLPSPSRYGASRR